MSWMEFLNLILSSSCFILWTSVSLCRKKGKLFELFYRAIYINFHGAHLKQNKFQLCSSTPRNVIMPRLNSTFFFILLNGRHSPQYRHTRMFHSSVRREVKLSSLFDELVQFVKIMSIGKIISMACSIRINRFHDTVWKFFFCSEN